MTKYFDVRPFPNEAAKEHAREVALNFVKRRRFFLHRESMRSIEGTGYDLDPNIFAEIIQIDSNIVDVYRKAKEAALKKIQAVERRAGVKEPTLRNGQKIVECSRYGGGATLYRIYPLTAFISTAPKTPDELRRQIFVDMMGDKTDDDISPKQRREYDERAIVKTEEIWAQLEVVDHLNPNNHRCMVILKPSFNLGCYGKLLCGGVLYNLGIHPLAAGCLLFNYSSQHRIPMCKEVLFSTTRADHVRMYHGDNKPPYISYHSNGGYDYRPMFAVIR